MGLGTFEHVSTCPLRLLDGHDRKGLRVELVQVLGDSVAGSPLVGPAGQPLVHHCFSRSRSTGEDPEHIRMQGVLAAPLVDGGHVACLLRHAVVVSLGADAPLGQARVLSVLPHPAAMQVAGFGPDADASEVDVVTDVDREPAPHARPLPAAWPPGLVAVSAGLRSEGLAHAPHLEPSAPAARLFEVALAGRRLGGTADRGGVHRCLRARRCIDADQGCQRLELHVEAQACGPLRPLAQVEHPRGLIRADTPAGTRLETFIAHACDLERWAAHLVLLAGRAHQRHLGARQPGHQQHIHGPLVRPDPDTRIDPALHLRIVCVEVVGLAPGGVRLRGVHLIVARLENRHGISRKLPAPDTSIADSPTGCGPVRPRYSRAMSDLIERVFETVHGWLELGHQSSTCELARWVRSSEFPCVYDANFAHSVRARSPAELDAFLDLLDQHFAGVEHRCIHGDPSMPPEAEARLLLEGFERGEELVQMLLEGELSAGLGRSQIRPVVSDADWAVVERLLAEDHREEVEMGFHDAWGPEVTAAIARCKRVKAPDVQYFLASCDGVDCAFFSAWPGENGIGKVEDLFTAREFRGRGIATDLIAHCVADARRRGAGAVLIAARAEDTPMRIYARLGFRPLCVQRIYLKSAPVGAGRPAEALA